MRDLQNITYTRQTTDYIIEEISLTEIDVTKQV